MRMRKKPNLIPRMEKCADVQVKSPQALKGKWRDSCGKYKKLYVEVGCGKGSFTAKTAATIPDALIVAIERVPDAMVIGMERVCDEKIENVRFIDADANLLTDIFETGEVDRIYINFCDPWKKKKQAKRRLTSPNFLRLYREILGDGGEIHFKTDNLPLFEYSLEQFTENGWTLSEVTRDLHANGPVGIMTDYEKKFYEQGVPINRCVAAKK